MQKRSTTEETTAICAMATLLINIVIVLTLCGTAWSAHEIFSRSELLGAIFQNSTWR